MNRRSRLLLTTFNILILILGSAFNMVGDVLVEASGAAQRRTRLGRLARLAARADAQ